jgi:hypothetical protein
MNERSIGGNYQTKISAGEPNSADFRSADVGYRASSYSGLAGPFSGRHARRMELGAFGVWQPSFLTTVAMAREIEEIGFPTLWIARGDQRFDYRHEHPQRLAR